jgi:rfaE bifunctional protein nucleotidyltransferase chain/domain
MNAIDRICWSLEDLRQRCQALKADGEKIVLTSGCFDLLHGGHLKYLEMGATFGQLVVGLNSDQFVKRLKGDLRPIRLHDDRAFVMAGFRPVSLVVVFDCDYELIRAVEPNYYLASTTTKNLRVHTDTKRLGLLKSIGAELIELEQQKDDSTSSMIKRVFLAHQ